MSDADNTSSAGFGKLVPGFDFLQNLAKQAAGSAAQNIPQLPNLGNWIAPTLNVEELDKRIEALKAVQFWLDQNAMALKATIQALEVQKMTLATLKGMNFNMGDVANAFKLKVADSVAGGMQKAADKAKTFSGLEIPETSYQGQESAAKPKARAPSTKAAAKAAAPAPGVVDPMQWWGALTKQFTTLATDAMKDGATDAARNLAGAMVKQSFDAAGQTLKKAVGTPARTAKSATGTAKAATGTARKRAPAKRKAE
jgi:hypothetical protein